jgi:protein TonB
LQAPTQSHAAAGARPARRYSGQLLARALPLSVLAHAALLWAAQQGMPIPAERPPSPPKPLALVEIRASVVNQGPQARADAAERPTDTPATVPAPAPEPPAPSEPPAPAMPAPTPRADSLAAQLRAPPPVATGLRREVASAAQSRAATDATQPATPAVQPTEPVGLAQLPDQAPLPEASAQPAPAADSDTRAITPLPGIAALDAEIAASRRNERLSTPPNPGPHAGSATPDRSGLAALDAEIAAARRQAERSSAAATARPARGSVARPTAPAAQGADVRAGTGASERTAAGDSRRAEQRYLSALRRALERERRYPPSARRLRLEGTARVEFTIAANGDFMRIGVSESAGAAALDDAAVHTVRRLARFEPIPAAIGRRQWTVRVPIVFRLN